jgi:hypothetical protein
MTSEIEQFLDLNFRCGTQLIELGCYEIIFGRTAVEVDQRDTGWNERLLPGQILYQACERVGQEKQLIFLFYCMSRATAVSP